MSQEFIQPAAISDDELHSLMQETIGIEPHWTFDFSGNSFGWLQLPSPDLLAKVAEVLAGKVRLCTITPYAEERDDEKKRRSVAYHFATGQAAFTVLVPLHDPEGEKKLPVPSITPWFRNADWNEREFHEMFNIDIVGHPNPKRLFLDERLDAGIMTKLIPFSAMANSAGTKTLWEQIMAAKDHASPIAGHVTQIAAVPDAPLKEPEFTPVAKTEGSR